MKIGKMAHIALKNVIRSRISSVVFVLILAVYTCAVDISFGSLSILQSQQQGLSRLLINLELLVEVAENEGAAEGSNQSYMDLLASLPHVAAVYEAADSLSIQGGDRERFAPTDIELTSVPEGFLPKAVEGSGISNEETQVALVPDQVEYMSGFVTKKVWKGAGLIGQTLTFQVGEETYRCQVKGTYDNKESATQIYIPMRDLQNLQTRRNGDGYYRFGVVAEEQKYVETIQDEVDGYRLEGFSVQLRDSSGQSELRSVSSMTMIYQVAVILLSAVAFFLVFALIAAKLSSEKKQAALLKVFGYHNTHLFLINWMESGMVALVGFLIGEAVSLFLCNQFVFSFLSSQFRSSRVGEIAVPLFSMRQVETFLCLFAIVLVSNLVLAAKTRNIYPVTLLKNG